MLLQCLPSSSGSIPYTVWEEMSFEVFQDPSWIWEQNDFSNSECLQLSTKFQLNMSYCRRGGHLGYRNGTILAILNLCVTVMLPIKCWLNPTYSLEGDVVSRILRWPPWIAERNNLAILNFYAAPMPPIKFRLNLNMVLEEISFEEFQDGRHGGHL